MNASRGNVRGSRLLSHFPVGLALGRILSDFTQRAKAAPLQSHSAPINRRPQILDGPQRHDPSRVDIVVGIIVVPLDVVEIDGLSDAWLLIEVA